MCSEHHWFLSYQECYRTCHSSSSHERKCKHILILFPRASINSSWKWRLDTHPQELQIFLQKCLPCLWWWGWCWLLWQSFSRRWCFQELNVRHTEIYKISFIRKSSNFLCEVVNYQRLECYLLIAFWKNSAVELFRVVPEKAQRAKASNHLNIIQVFTKNRIEQKPCLMFLFIPGCHKFLLCISHYLWLKQNNQIR